MGTQQASSGPMLRGCLVGSIELPSRWQPAVRGVFPVEGRRGQQTAASPAAPEPSSSLGGPQALYNEGLREGVFRPDARQAVTVSKLQALFVRLSKSPGQSPRRRPSGLTMVDSLDSVSRGSGSGGSGGWSLLGSLMGSSTAGSSSRRTGASTEPLTKPAVEGLYMHGGVGCGKTMLMDLFVDAAPAELQVLRTHYHDFMLDIHKSLRTHEGAEDPLRLVADKIASRARVLAMDEFFVTDVADAMILSRLFGRLWDRGLVLVATSNRAPDKLYEGGLQRALFMPFIQRLKVECDSHDMASPTDYRRLASHQRGLYFVEPSRDEDVYEEFVES
ncbi:hypothetical protein FOA52_008319 [Chlamydomonas sp. UWO 241]|nr:hypothetical protein FOA52_008319 [Chlamydomonas sp. UWO 241]